MLSPQLITRAPQTRCYQCGNTKIANICHQCGRAMCTTHSPTLDSTGKLLSVEFVALGLKDDPHCGESPVHCKDCAHVIRAQNPWLIIVGVVIALVSLRFLTDNLGITLSGMLIGGVLAVWGYYINRRRAEEAALWRPPLPLLPHFDSIQLQEKLQGKITLDANGRYHVSTSPVDGELTIVASLDKSKRDQQLQQYRKKYQLTDNEDIQFHAGFAVVRGPAGLKLRDEDANENRSNTVIPLTGQVNTQPFLSETDSRRSGEWRIIRRYGLLEGLDTAELPIHLIPSLVQEAAQRVLDLELRWPEPDSTKAKLMINRIESLELRVPIVWGEIERIRTDSAVISKNSGMGDNDGTVRTITWRQLSIIDEEHQKHRRTFSVRFDKAIKIDSIIRGRAELTFKGTLSGLKGIDLYYPLGRRRKEPVEDVIVKTLVLADFELSLAGLRYQGVRIVPDPKNENDKSKQGTATFEGVIPDHAAVIALTNTMSDQGFYVKRVIENAPRTGGRANVVNRSWDLAGRYYLGVYPIDFHLILTGEEVYSGEIRAQAGTTRTTLTVQGVYANPDMEEQIENVWERLNHLIGETLRQLPQVTPVIAQEVIEPQPAQPGIGRTEPIINSDRVEYVKVRRKRLDQLTDALLHGRISEKTYSELKTNIEQELQDFQAGA